MSTTLHRGPVCRTQDEWQFTTPRGRTQATLGPAGHPSHRPPGLGHPSPKTRHDVLEEPSGLVSPLECCTLGERDGTHGCPGGGHLWSFDVGESGRRNYRPHARVCVCGGVRPLEGVARVSASGDDSVCA